MAGSVIADARQKHYIQYIVGVNIQVKYEGIKQSGCKVGKLPQICTHRPMAENWSTLQDISHICWSNIVPALPLALARIRSVQFTVSLLV